MWIYQMLEEMDKAPDGYSFNYDAVQRHWTGRYQTPMFTTVVEGSSLEAVIRELYSNVSTRTNNGLVVRLPNSSLTS